MGVEVSKVLMYSGWAYTIEMKSSTSAQFFSDWIPPAVAQAPIVIKVVDMERISPMRAASCSVVTDPSTMERSYGPGDSARVASGKYAISIAPAMVRN